MANVLDPNNAGGRTENEADAETKQLQHLNFDYDYPRGFDLKPESDFHNKLRARIMARANDSHNTMSTRHSDWREIDKVLRTYVPPEQAEEGGKSKNKKSTDTVPKIIIPQSHATLETLLTYVSAAFLQDPIFSYEGVGPEDMFGATLLTQLVNQQAIRNKLGLSLHTQWRDSFAYGIGAVSPIWDRKFSDQVVVKKRGFYDKMLDLFTISEKEKQVKKNQLVFEGNRLINIDPYSYLPDPQASAHETEDCEFIGWVEKTNRMDLLRRDRDGKDYVFNAKYLRAIGGKSHIVQDSGNRTFSESTEVTSNNPVHVVWMYIDIIPSEWDLGTSQYPETWLFGVAGDKVVITAQPLGLNHGRKPIAVCAPDYDGYSANPISRLGIVHDIQNLINFLYSSHIQNVRKAINDMFVIDPSVISYHDVANPEPGKLIRMRRAAWGKGQLDQAIKQFDVRDVTQGHVADSMHLSEIMQQVSSATDNIKGTFPNRTSRISASEANSARSSSLSRLEKTARIISMQSMVPIGYMFASHIQQLMEEDTYVKAIGETGQRLIEDFGVEPDRGRVPVSPLDLVVNYDVIPHDGTIPGAEDAQTWIQLYQIIASDGMLRQSFDMQKIFKHIARQMGAKNVDDFVAKAQNVKPQVQEDANVQREVDKGNLVPMNNGQG